MAAGTEEGRRIFVVMNPLAGNCTAEDVRQALDRHFAPPHRYEVYTTTGLNEEDIVGLVRAATARGVSMVVAAGGDGTVSEVAEGLIGTNVPMGIVPVGTANVFARELALPLDLEGACAALAGAHTTTSVDAMRVGDKFYVLQIGVGIDSLMIRDTEREAKRRFGRAAYVWTAFTRLIGFQPVRFTILADGVRSRPRALQVLVANGGVLGIPPFRWGPHIRPNDGRVDVCVVSARTALDYAGLIWHTLIGQQRRDRNVRYYAARHSVVVSADKPLPVQADGEIIGETPIQIQVIPSAFQVAVPAPQADQATEPVVQELVST
jgi:YegS/Rv2252/BmrU family lipid kinase